MDIASLVPILLPLLLFLISMIVVFFLRALDSNSRRVKTVRKMLDQFQAELESGKSSFRTQSTELEDQVSKKSQEVRDMMVLLTGQLENLKMYSEDLAQLRLAMDTYRKALNSLVDLTTQTEQKVQQVNSDALQLEDVRDVIEQFFDDLKQIDEHLTAHEAEIASMEAKSIRAIQDVADSLHTESQDCFEVFRGKLDSEVRNSLNKIDEVFKTVTGTCCEFMHELDSKLKSTKEASKALHDKSADMLYSIVDRSTELTVQNELIEQAKGQRESLKEEIDSLKEEKALLEEILKEKTQVPVEPFEVPEAEAEETTIEKPIEEETKVEEKPSVWKIQDMGRPVYEPYEEEEEIVFEDEDSEDDKSLDDSE